MHAQKQNKPFDIKAAQHGSVWFNRERLKLEPQLRALVQQINGQMELEVEARAGYMPIEVPEV